MWYKKRLRNKKLTSKQVGLVHGFRSCLEEQIASEIKGLRVQYEFEETKLKYVKPQKTHTYTPDFYLPNQKIYIETKGLFTSADRQKKKQIKEH